MNACRNVCGLIFLFSPARRATRRTIRPALCRSIRCPSGRRKIGPSRRSLMARSIARAVHGAWDGDQLAALTQHGQGAVPAFETEIVEVGAECFGDPQPVDRQQADQRVLGGGAEPGRDQQRAELVAVQPYNVRFIIEPGSADVRGRGVLEQVAGQKGRQRGTLAVAQQRREPTPDSRR
jgi:hypothetical protein